MFIVTLATGNSIKDLQILIKSLEIAYTNTYPTLFVYTDDASKEKIENMYKGTLHIKTALNSYTGLNRQQMERIPGIIYKTKWTDFMCEKINALRWAFAFSFTTEGVWFLDADICLLAKLPEVPDECDLALAPHYIRSGDEAKYGHFNGGFLWMREPRFLDSWAEATKTSRFYEQSALEDVATTAKHLYEFPIQSNFGWWRLYQSVTSSEEMARQFGLNRLHQGAGLTFAGKPLLSVHTHFYEKNDPATSSFNKLLLDLLVKLGKHKYAVELMKALRIYS